MASNSPNHDTEVYDVFLCHNSAEKAEVRTVAENLRKCGIRPWLDERDLHPGRNWDLEIKGQIPIIPAVIIFLGNHGRGEYQEENEIKPFIKEKDRRKLPIIPVFLGSARSDLEMPDDLKDLQGVDLRKETPNPMVQLLEEVIGERYPDGILYKINKEKLKNITPEQRKELLILSENTINFWDDEITPYSTSKGHISISPSKTIVKGMVVEDLNKLNKLPVKDYKLEQEIQIKYVLDLSRYLLILGGSGSGKTTTLIELAKQLLNRADNFSDECIPVVLDLSRWQKEDKSFFDWIVDNLFKPKKKDGLFNWMTNTLYGAINKERIREWLNCGYLIPLLDGLDEVAPELRADCLRAINAYKIENEPPGLVVCCRTEEYEKLPRLELYAAIRLEPLEQAQIDQFLEQLGSDFQNLRTAINKYAILQELVKSPLMLNILPKATQSTKLSLKFLKKLQSLDEAKKYVLNAYLDSTIPIEKNKKKTLTSEFLESIFVTEQNKTKFPRQKMLLWLSLLAKNMTITSQKIFYIENMQPSWLDNWKQHIYRFFSAIIFSILVGMISWIVFQSIEVFKLGNTNHHTVYGLIIALVFGLLVNTNKPILCGLICMGFYFLTGQLFDGTNLTKWIGDGVMLFFIVWIGICPLNSIKPVKAMLWSWKLFLKKFTTGFFITGTTIGVLIGLIKVFISKESIVVGLLYGSMTGLVSGLIGGLLCGIVLGFTDVARRYRPDANPGIAATLGHGLFIYLVSLVILGVGVGIFYWMFGAEGESVKVALIISLQLALIPALCHGLAAAIKHYSLRLVLWLFGYTPSLPKFIPFLDFCCKLTLLKKGGGSYKFRHDIFQDYFTNLVSKTNAKK